MAATAFNDAELVAETLGGNRDAFSQIVVRYQSLICSLACSATGSLGQSEDLAQETFIAAWRRLRAGARCKRCRPNPNAFGPGGTGNQLAPPARPQKNKITVLTPIY